jgi:hypothetical protein
VIKAMAGHASEAMHGLYSKVSADETGAAVGAVVRLVTTHKGGDASGDGAGTNAACAKDSA